MKKPTEQGQASRRDRLILYDQTKLLFGSVLTSVWGTLLGGSVLVITLWPVIEHTILVTWAVMLTLITLGRAIHAIIFWRKAPQDSQSLKWMHQFTLGTILAALTWGSSAIWLFAETHPVYQVILCFILSVACAVALGNLSSLRAPVVAFMVISLLPLAIRFLLTDYDLGRWMGVLVLLLIMLMVMSALRVYRTTYASIARRLDSIAREEELRKSQERLSMHIQGTPVAVVEWDENFRVSSWNPAAERIFGYKGELMIGRHAAGLIVPVGARQEVDAIWKELLQSKGGVHRTHEAITREGKTILCEWYFTPLVDDSGTMIGVASLAQDVTERIRMEHIKNEFISVVSHELRTPLTSIRGSLGLVMGGVTGELPEKTREMLEIANNNTERLLSIINQILDIEKIESGELVYNYQTVEVMPLIEQAMLNNIGYAHQFEVHFELGERAEGAMLRADPERLMQVLNNLMSNAVKFTRKGDTVELGATRRGERIRVYITDHGPGIPAAFQNKLFDKFAQWDASDTRAVSGTGLGLSIAKGIIEQHDGQIGFETREGLGSTFYFELPELGAPSGTTQ